MKEQSYSQLQKRAFIFQNRTKRPSQLKQDWDLKNLKQTFADGRQLEENEINDREEKYDMKGGKDDSKALEKKLDQAFVDGEQGEEIEVDDRGEVEDVRGRGSDVRAQENGLKQESTNGNK